MWDFVVDKVAPGQVSSEYSVSPAKFIPPIAPKNHLHHHHHHHQSINQSMIGDIDKWANVYGRSTRA
jgi:hypothetical protein